MKSLRIFLFFSLFSAPQAIKFDVNAVINKFDTQLKQRCDDSSVDSECMPFCTYNVDKAFDVKNLKNLNPGWLILSNFIPGKCYVSELGKIFPAMIKFKSTEECCNNHRNLDDYSEVMKKFIETIKFDKMPNITKLKEEPDHCVSKACSGNTFKMNVRDIIACENTFVVSIMCYMSTLFKSVTSVLPIVSEISFKPADLPQTLEKLSKINVTQIAEIVKNDEMKEIINEQLAEHKEEILKVITENRTLKEVADSPILQNFLKNNGTIDFDQLNNLTISSTNVADLFKQFPINV